MEKSTGSVGQDAIRAGFQTSCREGIAKLLKIKEDTIEKCKEFMPRHMSELDKKIEDLKIKYITYYKEKEKYRNSSLTFMDYMRGYRKRNASVNVEVIIKDPFIDTVNGRISSLVISTVYITDNKNNIINKKWETFHDNICTEAKSGRVVYDSYETYSKTYIPDEVIELIKEAKEIGLESINIAYPVIEDGKPIDPIAIGFTPKIAIGHEQTMFIIAVFSDPKLKKTEYNHNA